MKSNKISKTMKSFQNDKNKTWICVSDNAYGSVYEKMDGSVIITGSWDGKGMKYDVHFRNK